MEKQETASVAKNIIEEINRCSGQATSTHLVNCFNFTQAFDAYVEVINAMCKVDLVALEGELVILTAKGKDLLNRHATNQDKLPNYWSAGLEEGRRDALIEVKALINSAGDADVARASVLNYCNQILGGN